MIDLAALVDVRGAVLFKLDPDGRMLSTNEPAEAIGDPAPDLYICLGGNRLRSWYNSHVQADVRTRFEVALGSPAATEAAVLAACRRIGEQMQCSIAVAAGPAFAFAAAPTELSGETLLVTPDSRDVIAAFPYIHRNLELLSPCLVKIVGSEPVSICRTVRRFGAYVECGVDTLPGHEGHGYGSAVVRDWGAASLGVGLIPLYSTDWENKASRALARRLGLVQYATDMNIRLC